ncbi:MAG TPA: tail fiber domain-containing protein [Candidatus Binatia bacterium]|jgi:hypothetical protein|nr:tail fiber domain-containing protein [Candidatus Binatia bacterium]
MKPMVVTPMQNSGKIGGGAQCCSSGGRFGGVPRCAVLAVALISTLFGQPSTVRAQGTAFTYQGELNDGGNPANGLYDIRVGLYLTSTGSTVFAGPITNAAVAVSNGLFTITLDYGGVFDGTTYWLQIAVRTNNVGAFKVLSPRQQLTPTPYAIFAEGASAAGLSGTIPAASLSGTYGGAVNLTNPGDSFNGNGGGLTGLNASQLTTGTVPAAALGNAWQIAGNAGTSATNGNFVGTTDYQPLELHINGTRALRLEPTANDANHSGIVNVAGGAAVNSVGAGVYGATIAGGGANNYFGSPGTNSVVADFGTVGGGSGNLASGSDNYYTTPLLGYSTVGGGVSNSATGSGSFVGGGGYGAGIFAGNVASGDASVVSGGLGNTASGGHYGFTTVGGGYGNTASFSYATVAGGFGNTASLNDTTVGGGAQNTASGVMATVAGGYHNAAIGQASTVAGGYYNTSSIPTSGFSTVGGGSYNTASGTGYGYSTVGGGTQNTASGDYSTVSGGYNNTASSQQGTVGGGYGNTASGASAVVPGGAGNVAKGAASFAAGNGAQALNDDCFIWSDGEVYPFSSSAPNQFLVYAGGGVGIGTNHPQAQLHVTSSGGNSFPQAQLDQQTASDFSRLRFTVGGNANKRWDVGATTTNFVIYSGSIGATMLLLDSAGLTVRGTFVSSSDRNVKAGFEPVDTKTVLERVAAMPITRWHYTNDLATPHLGPMAQDFYAAFNVGLDDKHIATVDEEGVALAAIQGLNQKVDSENTRLREELKRRDAENAALQQRLVSLENIIRNQKSN